MPWPATLPTRAFARRDRDAIVGLRFADLEPRLDGASLYAVLSSLGISEAGLKPGEIDATVRRLMAAAARFEPAASVAAAEAMALRRQPSKANQAFTFNPLAGAGAPLPPVLEEAAGAEEEEKEGVGAGGAGGEATGAMTVSYRAFTRLMVSESLESPLPMLLLIRAAQAATDHSGSSIELVLHQPQETVADPRRLQVGSGSASAADEVALESRLMALERASELREAMEAAEAKEQERAAAAADAEAPMPARRRGRSTTTVL